MRKYILFLAIFLLPSLAQSETEIKGSPSELLNYLSSLPKVVSLTGEARLEIQSDSGIVTIGIRTENSQLQKSLQNNQNYRSEIISRLKKSGISQDKGYKIFIYAGIWLL